MSTENSSEQSLIEREIAAYLAGIDRAVASGAFPKPPTIEQRVRGAWGHLSLICDEIEIDDVEVVVNSIESMKAHGVDVVGDKPTGWSRNPAIRALQKHEGHGMVWGGP